MNYQLSVHTSHGYMICISFTEIKVSKLEGTNNRLEFYKNGVYMFDVNIELNKLKFSFKEKNCIFYDLIRRS